MAEKRRGLRAYRRAWSARSLGGAARPEHDAVGHGAVHDQQAVHDQHAVDGCQAGAPRGSTARTASAPAQGHDPVVGGGLLADRLGFEAERGALALATIDYPWPDVLDGWTIYFLPGRPGLLGGTWTYEHRIEVYVRPEHTVLEVAFTLAHELGHAVDVVRLCDVGRARWRSARGIAYDVPWWVESGATDFDSCSGDWAEAFAVWQVGGHSASRAAAQPTPAQLRLLARLAS